jgi:hypothetical protein
MNPNKKSGNFIFLITTLNTAFELNAKNFTLLNCLFEDSGLIEFT